MNSRSTIRSGRRIPRRLRAGLFISAALAAVTTQAQAQDAASCPGAEPTCTVGERVVYMPGFFAQYNPITALDMVQRVPGFSVESGDEVRGFGGAAGNVLIDGQRPSTKSSDIEDTLSRIGAANVERIELIRGGTGALDVGGRSVVVNVVQKQGASAKTSPWSFALYKRRPNGGVRPQGNASYSGAAGGVDYTLGAELFGTSLTVETVEEITRYAGADETRIGGGRIRDVGGGVTLNLEKRLDNGDTARLNLEGAIYRSKEALMETRFLAVGGPDLTLFPFSYREHGYEVGGDYEHAFSDTFDIKLIGVFKRSNESFDSGFVFLPAAGADDQSLFVSDKSLGETIGRVEFSWRRWSDHAIQFGGEIAQTFIASEADFFVDDGMGALTPQVIDGANTRVSELRSEMFVNDSWRAGEKLTVDIGMAVELSRIAQSGDSENSRFFTYPKPSLAFTYAATPKTQLRLSARRDVNQLSFDEFISAVNFQDEDVDFGNPDLQPQRSWVLEASYERRFGEIGVAKLTGFYKYVNDVEDLLPISGVIEVPGNIGDGKIWGGELALTLPLDAVLLKNARLESKITVQESSVTDPVTEFDREFSDLAGNFYELEFRQDFPAKKISWGWAVDGVGVERDYGLDEITTRRVQNDISVYVETTALKGLKIRAAANDILNVINTTDRTVYDGSRALDVPLFREYRQHKNGGGVTLTVSGTF